MATVSRVQHGCDRSKRCRAIVRPLALRLVLVGLTSLLVLACTSIRPVTKIGLLAPFEGLYRRTGYDALAAMRLALADAPPTAPDLLPLALDTSRDPARAAQKLLADPLVQAVVGPFSLNAASAAQPILAAGRAPWLVPFAVDPTSGFVAFDHYEQWAQPLVARAAEAARRLGCRRLVLAGWPTAWSTAGLAAVVAQSGLALILENDPTLVQLEDAVLHLGELHNAASFANELQNPARHPPFFLGPQGEDMVFVEQSQNIGGVSWLAWLDDQYSSWATANVPASPWAYQVYRATQAAVAPETGRPLDSAPSWRLQWFVYDKAGQPHPAAWPSGTHCSVETVE